MSQNSINGKYESGFIQFKYGSDHPVDASIKTPSILEKIFSKTVRVELKDDSKTRSLLLKQKDIAKFLESNEIEVSPYLNKNDLVNLFCDFVNQKEITTAKKTLAGKCLNGRITLDVWKNDANGITLANFWQRLFKPTTKIRILEGHKFHTYTVVRKNLIKSAQEHGLDVNQKTSNPTLIEKIKEQVAGTIKSKPKPPSEKPVYTVNPVKGQLLKTTATPSFSKTGERIEGRAENESLLLADLIGSQFALATYPENSVQLPKEAIFLQVNGDTSQQTVYIDAQELADRYHLPLADIKLQAQEGKLAEFLNSKRENIALLDQVLANYERMFDKQTKLKQGNFSPLTLMKVVRIAVKNQAFNRAPIIEDKPFLKEGDRYFPLFQGKKLHLVQLNDSLPLIPGNFAQVSRNFNPISGHRKVLKIGVPTLQQGMTIEEMTKWATKAIKNEFELLHFLHKDFPGGKIPGIQKAPHAVSVFSKMDLPTGALLTTEYDYDLFTALGFDGKVPNIFKNIDQKLEAFYPLLKGFEYCVLKKNLGHGDIKIENILVKDGKLDLADFGDARILGKNTEVGITTPQNSPVGDMDLLNAQGITPNDFNLHFLIKDAYALGEVFYTLLTDGEKPYNLTDYDASTGPYDPANQFTYTPEGHPPLQAPFQRQRLEDLGIPPEIIEIVEGMCELTPAARMDVTEALEKFDDYRTKFGLPVMKLHDISLNG